MQQTITGRDRPLSRTSHSANVRERLRVLSMFGGSDSVVSNKLWMLDLVTWTWTMPECKGVAPSWRRKHATCTVGTVLVIYGGGKPGALSMNDMYTIDLARKTHLVWHKLEFKERVLPERRSATMGYVGAGRILIHGGFCNNFATNSLVVIDDVFTPKRSYHSFGYQRSPTRSDSEALTLGGDHPGMNYVNRVVAQDKLYVLGTNNKENWGIYELTPE